MEAPDGLRYSNEHEWVRADEGMAEVGITDYAQDQLGDIVYLDLPTVGAKVAQNEKMGEIESVKAVSDLFSPVGGELVEVNQEVIDDPELVNQEPYRRGWLFKVNLSDAGELESLLSAEAYRELVAAEEEEAG